MMVTSTLRGISRLELAKAFLDHIPLTNFLSLIEIYSKEIKNILEKSISEIKVLISKTKIMITLKII